MHVPLMIGTEVSHRLGIPTSMDNPVSCAQANGNGSMSSALTGEKLWLGLGLDGHGPVPKIPAK